MVQHPVVSPLRNEQIVLVGFSGVLACERRCWSLAHTSDFAGERRTPEPLRLGRERVPLGSSPYEAENLTKMDGPMVSLDERTPWQDIPTK